MKKFLALAMAAICSLATLALTACNNSKKAELNVLKTISLTAEDYAFAINKENTELKTSVNAILADMKE